MWTLPRPGIKPLYPALAGEFLPTAPPGRSSKVSKSWNSEIYLSWWLERRKCQDHLAPKGSCLWLLGTLQFLKDFWLGNIFHSLRPQDHTALGLTEGGVGLHTQGVRELPGNKVRHDGEAQGHQREGPQAISKLQGRLPRQWLLWHLSYENEEKVARQRSWKGNAGRRSGLCMSREVTSGTGLRLAFFSWERGLQRQMGIDGEGAKERGLDPEWEEEPLFASSSPGIPHFHFFWSLVISPHNMKHEFSIPWSWAWNLLPEGRLQIMDEAGILTSNKPGFSTCPCHSLVMSLLGISKMGVVTPTWLSRCLLHACIPCRHYCMPDIPW